MIFPFPHRSIIFVNNFAFGPNVDHKVIIILIQLIFLVTVLWKSLVQIHIH